MSVVPAGAANAQEEPAPRPGLVPYDGEVINGDVRQSVSEPGVMPAETEDGLWDMVVGNPGLSVNSFEWDAASETLLIYSATDRDTWASLAQKYLPNQETTLIPATHSKEEIDAELHRMAERGGRLASGDRIVTAVPAKDGSSITVGLELSGGAKARLDASALVKELNSSIPVQVEVAPDVQPATRNIGYYTNFFSGAYMQSSDADRSCTTGYRIGRLSGGTPGMLSAEHCGRDHIGSNWHYSSVSNSASLLGQFNGMLTVSSLATTDTGLWTGGNVAAMYPGIFTGNHTDGDPLESIRGASIPVLGNYVCYTGSRSGNVCSNEVTATGTLVCYSVTMCYYGTTWTSQIDSKEAAGNGDSGGPVYRRVGGLVYGAGIISGIVGGSTTCTGDPGTSTRSCSPVALFAPLDLALGAGTGWGFSYVP